MKKVFLSSVLFVAGVVLAGCAHTEQSARDQKSTGYHSAYDNTTYQTGHSSKLGKMHGKY